MIFKITLVVIFLVTAYGNFIQAQVKQGTLSFHASSIVENVDFWSFQPALMLKHRIGVKFNKYPKNPVLRPSSRGWDSKDVADPFVLVRADSIMLFYDGSGPRDQYHIGYAVRDPSGWFWEKGSKIVDGSGADWDHYHQIAPVVFNGKDGWRLYYNGNSSDDELGYQWGMLVKPGSGKWRYVQQESIIPLAPSSWDLSGNAYGDILFFPETNRYRMWYTGFQGPLASVGMAESDDGIHWKKVGNGPVLSILPGVISPDIIFNGETYLMYFVQLEMSNKGMRTKICRAESPDGRNWNNIQDVLLPDRKWEKRRLVRPHVSYFDGRVQLFYCAGRGRWRIGGAYTLAEFQLHGRWQSNPLSPGKSKIQIKYEAPGSTSLTVKVAAAGSGNYLPLDLAANRIQLREDVFKSILPIPPEIKDGSRTWQIELNLKTEDLNSSPVVYEIRLLP